MTTDSNREAFERWAAKDMFDIRRDTKINDLYLSVRTHDAWSGWQAATAHNKEKLREVRDAMAVALNDADGNELNMSNYHHDDVHGLNNAYVALFLASEQAIATLNEMIGGE